MSATAPVEQKVKAASLASLAASFIVGLIVLQVDRKSVV